MKEHSASIGLSLRIIDCLCLLVAGLLSFWLRFSHLSINNNYINLLFLGVMVGAGSLSFFGAYRAWRGSSFTSETQCISKAIITTFILLILSGFITQSSEIFSRIWTVTWFSSSIILILSCRYILRKSLGVLRAKGYNIRSVIIIGDNTIAEEVALKIAATPNTGLVVQGFISTAKSSKTNISIAPCLGSLKELDNIVDKHHIDQVWIALPMDEVEKMKKVQNALRNSTATIRLVPDIYGFELLNHSITEVAGLPVINLSTSHMLEGKNRFLKLLEDQILALIILTFISPLLIAIAISIKFSSPGPILFKQYRTGANGKKVKVYKFRSMVVHQEENNIVTQAKKGDSRVTRVGAFLRKTSLDELPQFINVLQGRMSIVGPRPHALAHNQYYKELVESYMRRHMVKPGITGWAQINGFRGETDTIDKMENRVKYDLYYIENWSIWLDLKIIFLTIFKGFIHKNAI
ncbi:undecaprenyl-phosphate glucose phosphotransferase [Marinomonas arenicola]|uniref:undecaprenyl-phosphate glucose phosphotransferase n=1 Tax=Marinomonas arenicola TaxID=569601 RepID=UPI00311E2539